MKNKKNIFILSIFFILIIQILLILNNRQKTSFRYFIWNVKEVSIGNLISISFFSGLLMSSLVNKALDNENRPLYKNEEVYKTNTNNEFPATDKIDNESYEIPPERDIRDPQPTISVNYRIIKENDGNEINDKEKAQKREQSLDDWNNYDSEW